MKSFTKKLLGAICAVALAAGVGSALGAHQEIKSVKADTVAINHSSIVGMATSATANTSGTYDVFTFTVSNGLNATESVRVYKSETITIASSGGNMTSVEFTCTVEGTTKYGPGCLTGDGYVAGSSYTGTWTGDAASFSLTASSNQARIVSFKITYTPSSSTTYTITYDANGGSGTMADTTGAAPQVAACAFTAPEGKRFSTWNTEDDGSGTDYAVGAIATSDLDLYAIWVDKPVCVTLEDIGANLGSEYSDDMSTVDIVDGSDTYTLNYVQCKKQGNSMIMANSSGAFISNHTQMPGAITGVELFINSGAAAAATYDVAFGTSEFTTETAGIGAVNITGGNSHTFANESVSGATYFCVTLGTNKNGQVLKIVIYYENGISTTIVDNHEYPISTYELTEGGTSLVFKYFDLDNNNITGANWVASDDTIVHVNPKGSYTYISGLKVGTATVTASKEGYKPATCTFTVVADPSKSDLTPHEYDGSSAGATADDTTIIWNDTVGLYEYVALDDDGNIVTTAVWTSSDPTVATVTSSEGIAAVTTLKPGSFTLEVAADGYNSGTATIKVWESYLESIVVSGSMTKTAYKSSESWDPTGFTVTATFQSSWTADVTSEATWTYNPAAPADGVTSVVATATYTDGIYTETADSAAQAVTVTVSHAGTAEDPFTVAEALAKATEIGAVGNVGQGPWVTKGIISRVTSVPAATYWNATYYISDDGSSTNELQVYRGFYLDNAKFDDTTKELLKPGKVVTVTGNLTGSYGSEYCAGNYLLSIEDKPTGDIDVTFEPTDSLEVGATGTLTASTTAQNPHYEFSVDNESIFDLDYTTGEYEVLDVGVVEVTVTVTSDDGNGQASAFITLNGNSDMMKNVTQANAIAATVESGKTTQYYYYFEGYVSQFNCDGQSRALMITTFDESDSIEVFVGKSGYSAFIEGLNLGDAIRFKANVQNYNGTYELTSPVKTFSEYISLSFCFELLSLTDAVCHDYDDVTDNKDALEPIWEALSPKYSTLNDVQQKVLVNPDTYGAGATIKNAMARYDYLVDKYDLDNFIIGRTPSGLNNTTTVTEQKDETTFMIIVTVVGLISLTAISTLLIAKRRKDY